MWQDRNLSEHIRTTSSSFSRYTAAEANADQSFGSIKEEKYTGTWKSLKLSKRNVSLQGAGHVIRYFNHVNVRLAIFQQFFALCKVSARAQPHYRTIS
jgi:hypothetical protein